MSNIRIHISLPPQPLIININDYDKQTRQEGLREIQKLRYEVKTSHQTYRLYSSIYELHTSGIFSLR